MDKKEFFKQVTKELRQGIADLNFLKADLDVVEEAIKDTKKYNKEYIKNTLIPKRDGLKRQIERRKEAVLDEVQKMTDDRMGELKASDGLNPAEITEDARFLNIGVTLSLKELTDLYDRNEGNNTMQRLITDYAKERNINLPRVYAPANEAEMTSTENLPRVCQTALRWYYNDNVYEQVLGENTDCYRAFNE